MGAVPVPASILHVDPLRSIVVSEVAACAPVFVFAYVKFRKLVLPITAVVSLLWD